ncbi:MAG: hypothetical protein ACK4WH_07820 [Phycisphaerales bacterium]
MNTELNKGPSGSLLEGIDLPEKPRKPGKPPRAERPFVPPILRDNRLTRWCGRNKGATRAGLAVLLIGAGVGVYLALRPMPQPDYATAPMDDLLDYTLLTDDFNNLPVARRRELLKELIERFTKMSSSDSAAMAAWAAMIEGDLREQIFKNASKLAIDTWDEFAVEYATVPEVERSAYLDKTIVDFFKMMESFNPNGPRNVTDEQRLEEARAQAKRDQDMMRSDNAPSSGQLGQMADFLRNGMGRFATPQAQIRSQQLMRDMTRHLRGQDITTGKPKPR